MLVLPAGGEFIAPVGRGRAVPARHVERGGEGWAGLAPRGGLGLAEHSRGGPQAAEWIGDMTSQARSQRQRRLRSVLNAKTASSPGSRLPPHFPPRRTLGWRCRSALGVVGRWSGVIMPPNECPRLWFAGDSSTVVLKRSSTEI